LLTKQRRKKGGDWEKEGRGGKTSEGNLQPQEIQRSKTNLKRVKKVQIFLEKEGTYGPNRKKGQKRRWCLRY